MSPQFEAPRRKLTQRRVIQIGIYVFAVLAIAGVLVATRNGDGDAPAKERAAAPAAPADGATATTLPVIQTVKAKGSVLDVLGGLDDASRFREVVASLPDQPFLQERGVTLLVPPDSALSAKDAAKLTKDPNAASAFISRHLIIGGHTLEDLGTKVTTSDGTERKIDADEGSIDGVEVTTADIEATNGYLQLLDGKLA